MLVMGGSFTSRICDLAFILRLSTAVKKRPPPALRRRGLHLRPLPEPQQGPPEGLHRRARPLRGRWGIRGFRKGEAPGTRRLPAQEEEKRWRSEPLEIGDNGLRHEVPVVHGGVESHGVGSAVLLLDGAAHVTGGIQTRYGLSVFGEHVPRSVDGQSSGRQVEGGDAADDPDAVVGVEVGEVLAPNSSSSPARAWALWASMVASSWGRSSAAAASSTEAK